MRRRRFLRDGAVAPLHEAAGPRRRADAGGQPAGRSGPRRDERGAESTTDGDGHLPPPALELVHRLADALERAGIVYCHWKSNESIGRSVSGENDLDLLVARHDGSRFTSVLLELGFVTARPAHERQVPGVLDHYGLDPTGKVVHVHAHHQLVLGDDTTKNFRLPIEEAYLRTASRREVLRLPSVEVEYVVFVLRMVLKHSTWDAQLMRKGRLTPSERRELAYLEGRVDLDQAVELVTAHLPFIDPSLFAACREVAGERERRLVRVVTAHRLLRALDTHGRRAGTADLALRVWRRQRFRRIGTRAVRGRLPASGGLLVGVVGGDGSGKTTTVEHLEAELSRHLDTRSFHMGKPPPSRLTRAVRRPMRRLRELGLFQATALAPWAEVPRFPGLGFVVWHLLTARDRRLEYRRARRAASWGSVAICDRYPLDAVRLMDARRTDRLPGLYRRPLARWLAGREARCYDRILPPDLLVVLRVRPETAVARRHDEEAEFVRRRAEEVGAVDWASYDAVVVDAEAPQADVQAQVLAAVWAAL